MNCYYPNLFDCVDYKLWKILKEIGIPDHQTCLLRSMYAGQEATVRTGHGTTDWFQIGKGVRQGCILSRCRVHISTTYMQSTLLETLGWRKHKMESRLPGEISITSDRTSSTGLETRPLRISKGLVEAGVDSSDSKLHGEDISKTQLGGQNIASEKVDFAFTRKRNFLNG